MEVNTADASNRPFRVLLMGPPFSGKLELITGLAHLVAKPRELFEHHAEFRHTGSFVTCNINNADVQVLTLSGMVTSTTWKHYAEKADKVMLVLDSTPATLEEDLLSIALSAQWVRGRALTVFWTKVDVTHLDTVPPPIQRSLAALEARELMILPIDATARAGHQALVAQLTASVSQQGA